MKTIYGNFVCVAAAVIAGCKDLDNITVEGVSPESKMNSTTWVVAVGMENSKFAGPCVGSGLDAQRMTKVFRQYTPHVRTFISDLANKDRVKSAMVEAAQNSDLFIFYYSGHGGQQRFWDTGTDENDGMDEFLCFYDTYMRDNEVWEVISKAKGRVMCIFDACHSQDLYREVKPITLKAAMPLSVTHNEQGSINLLVWSGCPANTVSYGSALGGKMTNTLLKYFDSYKTYDYLWNEMENDKDLQKFEIIQRTIIGNGFVGKTVFQ